MLSEMDWLMLFTLLLEIDSDRLRDWLFEILCDALLEIDSLALVDTEALTEADALAEADWLVLTEALVEAD